MRVNKFHSKYLNQVIYNFDSAGPATTSKTMSSLRSPSPSSARSSMSDIPIVTSDIPIIAVQKNDSPLRESFSNSDHGSMDDLDIEDPLSRVYVRDDEFEPFSRSEVGFIGASVIGVVTVPLLYLIVNRIQVFR